MILHIIVSSTERNGGLYPAAHFCAHEIYIITNNGVFIKYRNQKPKNNFYIKHHSVFSKFFLCISPLGGDTIFLSHLTTKS